MTYGIANVALVSVRGVKGLLEAKEHVLKLCEKECSRSVLWARVGESYFGLKLKLVQETTDKVVLIKEKLKAARDHQKSYALEGRSAFWKKVRNLKKCLADANLHVPLDEIKVDKTLHFVEEPVEIMDQEIKKLNCRNIALVKVRWNLKCGPEFTWEHDDHMRIKYPQSFVDQVVEPAS
ncbi:hypothetical protein Tco_0925185 [Tanacetum coccineum]|uniref:Reverse transcriptase domain-containing protein n=1 Tax=Tanacetum coccineum TaxID=301880 RepID=A0ABQ5D641_9ASTR